MKKNPGRLRLQAQQLIDPSAADPRAAVSHLLGLQGQDLASVSWSIGLRVPGSTASSVERAFSTGAIVRTWPMRGTLHVVAAEDVRWLLALTSPGNVQRTAYRRRQLELDDQTLKQSRKVLSKTLRGVHLTREELLAALNRAKISTAGQRGYHLLWDAAVHELICSGAPRGKEQTFALLDEWLPQTNPRPREEALAELARRYFTSRGPATLDDLAWWSGLTLRECRAGLEASASSLQHVTEGARTWWMPKGLKGSRARTAFALPGFDEYLLGYQDRGAVLDPRHADRICLGGNGVFAPTLVLDGKVVGSWRRATLAPEFFVPVKPVDRQRLEAALERYRAFIQGSSKSAVRAK